jgi:hypothetical protein
VIVALFFIQDADRPTYVCADDYSHAVEKWRRAVARENDGDYPLLPDGVSLVADDSEIIIDDDFVGGLEPTDGVDLTEGAFPPPPPPSSLN